MKLFNTTNVVVYDDILTKKDTCVYINGVKLCKFIPVKELEQILKALDVPFTVEFRGGKDD